MAIRNLSHIALAASAAALALMPTTASAQAMAGSASSLAWSKSEAILGAPSALQAILSQQHAAPRVAVAPASFSMPQVTSAVLRVPASDEGIHSNRPDVFGSVALRVDHTPLDARWHSVEHTPVSGGAARFAESFKHASPLKQLEAVNWYVNGRVQFEDDIRHFGRADVWSSANDTLRSGRGDCEDYAIAKMQMLRAAGFPDRDLYLVVLRDLVRRADHAVLVARAAGRMVVLDNGTDELIDTDKVSDYRPILTFASYGEWTHGYRVDRAPIYIAENRAVPAAPVAPAEGGDQRSRSASLLAFNTGFKR
jgi:predicted transglutaminase-like cysteine proteinase